MKINKYLLKFDQEGTRVYIPNKKYSVDLSLSENPLGFSQKVIETIDKEKFHINHYPDSNYTELKAFLAKKFNLNKDNFIFGTGSDGLIEDIMRVLINIGDKIVMPELTFLNASFASIISGGEVIFSKMKEDFHIDFLDLKEKIDPKTKIVFICNPNNPTGLIELREDILNIVSTTESIVIVDEANIEFGGETLISDINNYKNLIVLRTFSKGYGIAGMRIGYCVGAKNLMYYIWRLRPPFPNTYLSQKTALAVLQDEEHIEKSRNYVKNEREFLQNGLEKRGFRVIRSEANCFLVKVTPNFKSSSTLCDLLHKYDCTVVNGKDFKGLGEDYIRIAPQLHERNIEFLDIIDKLLNLNLES